MVNMEIVTHIMISWNETHHGINVKFIIVCSIIDEFCSLD